MRRERVSISQHVDDKSQVVLRNQIEELPVSRESQVVLDCWRTASMQPTPASVSSRMLQIQGIPQGSQVRNMVVAVCSMAISEQFVSLRVPKSPPASSLPLRWSLQNQSASRGSQVSNMVVAGQLVTCETCKSLQDHSCYFQNRIASRFTLLYVHSVIQASLLCAFYLCLWLLGRDYDDPQHRLDAAREEPYINAFPSPSARGPWQWGGTECGVPGGLLVTGWPRGALCAALQALCVVKALHNACDLVFDAALIVGVISHLTYFSIPSI
ncbi:Protein of unknown function [Gryllus bimaculatus]|nr:Protein of unknown function [Gryllus bimaculatus]